jgi:hypothetical protein
MNECFVVGLGFLPVPGDKIHTPSYLITVKLCTYIMFLHIKENALEMFLRTIYETIQMNLILNFIGNRAKRHAYASSNICRMPHTVTEWSVEQKLVRFLKFGSFVSISL